MRKYENGFSIKWLATSIGIGMKEDGFILKAQEHVRNDIFQRCKKQFDVASVGFYWAVLPFVQPEILWIGGKNVAEGL